jgi:CrcB protein
MHWIAVAIGGAVGSVMRYLLAGWIQQSSEWVFPLGTFAVNVIGCFVVGVLAAFFECAPAVRPEWRVGLMAGVLGGFTTFSTFGLETFRLASSAEWKLALVNVLASTIFGVVAVWCGYRATLQLVAG